MKNYFSLRALVAALGLGGAVLRAGAATLSVDSVITSGLSEPHSVALAPDGTAYITDGVSHRVLRIPPGLSSFVPLAGEANVPGSNNGTGEAAHFNIPQGIIFARGGLIVADSESQLIRFVSTSGVVSQREKKINANAIKRKQRQKTQRYLSSLMVFCHNHAF